jgi:signal transduction histidine kinase
MRFVRNNIAIAGSGRATPEVPYAMLDFIARILDSDDLAPHGICLLWRPELIWTHVVSDAVIGAAYFSIPLALAYFVSRRPDVVFSWIFWCFAAFILACGTTHFFSIWTLWNPDYGTEAVIKGATAIASLATAVALWPLLPKALAIPSPRQLQDANVALSQGVRDRDEALRALEAETSQRLKTEEMLRQSQKMEAVGQLTGGVAHDFNNLLTVVVGNLERIARRNPAIDADTQRALQSAMAGAERAAALTQQLLAFARKQPLRPVTVHPNELVENLSGLLRRTLGENITLELDLAASESTIEVDRNQMENALLNLTVNARDAMPDGGRLTIRTRSVTLSESDTPAELRPGRHTLIEVADTGFGMDADTAERAFEPFFTTKPVGQGTGLGLSQVYGFVRQSRGHVELRTEAGQGTRARILLPRSGTELTTPSPPVR